MANTKQPNETVSTLGDTQHLAEFCREKRCHLESHMGEVQKAPSEEAELVPRSKQLVAAT